MECLNLLVILKRKFYTLNRGLGLKVEHRPHKNILQEHTKTKLTPRYTSYNKMFQSFLR